MPERFTFEEATEEAKQPRRFTFEDAVRDREASGMEALTRGVINSPARTLQGVEAMVGAALPRTSENMLRPGDALAEKTEALADRFAPRAEEGAPSILERTGEQAVPGALGMTVAGLAGGPMAALGEAALAFSTPAVGAAAESLGATPGQAAAAEMAYNVLAPSAAVRALRGMGYRGPMQPGLHRLSANRAARSMVPEDPTGQGTYAIRSADKLDAETAANPNPLERRTSEMVLADDAPNFENLAIRKAQTDPRFQARMGGRKMHLADVQDVRLRAALGDPDPTPEPLSGLRSTWETSRDTVHQAASQQFKQMDLAGADPASTSYLKRAIDEATDEAKAATRKYLPKTQIRLIEDFGDKIPWDELRALDQELGEQYVRAARGGMNTRARWINKLRDAIDETVQNAPDDIAQQYPEAMASWRSYKQTFDPKSRAYKAFADQKDPRRFVQEIMDGKGAVDEVRRVAGMLGDDVDALRDFRTMVARDTLMPEVGSTGPKAIRNRYLKRREALKSLYSEDELRLLDEAVNAGIEDSASKVGRRSMNYGAGSSTLQQPPEGSRNFFVWLARSVDNQVRGSNMMTNRVMESYLDNTAELAPVLRAWKRGNMQDAAGLVFGQSLKTLARTAAYPRGQDQVIEQALPAFRGNQP